MKLDNIANSSTNDPDVIMNVIESELRNVKFKAFGKVKVRKSARHNREELEALIARKEKLLKSDNDDTMNDEEIRYVEAKLGKELQKKQKKELDEQLDKITKTKELKGKSAAVFDLKGKILGKKKDKDNQVL